MDGCHVVCYASETGPCKGPLPERGNVQDPRIEASLNANPNLAWEYIHAIGIHQVDEQKSFNNQARIQEPLDKALVVQYQQAVRAGDRFPALTLYEDSPGKYVLVDGNHRYAAYKAEKITTFDAYLVVADDPSERTALTFELNTLNGRPTSDEDRAHQAVTLVHQGFARSAVALRLHVTQKFVDDSVADYQGLERARLVGVGNTYTAIPSKFQRTRLYHGFAMDKAFALAVQFVAKFPMLNKEVTAFIEQVQAYGNETDQLAYIRSRHAGAVKAAEIARKAKKTRRRSGGGAAIHVLFNAHLAYFESIDEDAMILGMTSEERESLGKRIDTVLPRLQVLESRLQN